MQERSFLAANRQIQSFERIARDDSTMLIYDVAKNIGLSSRQLERTYTATFWHASQARLRRSRFEIAGAA